jgi:hypothetical protein
LLITRPEPRFLDGSVVDRFGRDARAESLGDHRHQILFAGPERERGVADIGRGLAERAPAVRQVLEQQCLFPRLIEQGAHLGQRIDGFRDADKLFCRFQLGDPGSHVFGLAVGPRRGHHRTILVGCTSVGPTLSTGCGPPIRRHIDLDHTGRAGRFRDPAPPVA